VRAQGEIAGKGAWKRDGPNTETKALGRIPEIKRG